MTSKERGKVSDEAVAKATGKNWQEWFAYLDEKGGVKMEHKAIAKQAAIGGASAWWAQMVSVEYERARGLRKMHEKADGFEVSVSKTVPLHISELYVRTLDYFQNQPVEIRKANADKSIRITWPDATNVVAHVWDKGPEKSQLVIMHEKLADQNMVEVQRAYWKKTIPEIVQL